jgi:hypothetical protein
MTTLIWTSLAGFFLLFTLKMIYVATVSVSIQKTGGALYVSSSRKRIRAAVAAVPTKQMNLVVDLGCGDGRVLRTVSKTSGATCIGYEINLLAWAKAKLLCLAFTNIHIHRKNFRVADLSGADVVFCYLFPDVMPGLAEKLSAELKPGAAIVSFNFPLPGFSPQTVLHPDGSLHSDPIYIYQQS